MVGTALAIASGVGSLLGGLFGSHAAKSAAQIQQEAAQNAATSIKQSVVDTNPQVTDAAKNAGDQAIGAATTAGAGVTDAATSANALLNPYAGAGATAAGVLSNGIAPGGDFNKTPTMADITIDPGYAFREQQAELAMERSAAAHGGVDNGGYIRDLNTFSQGNASQEYAAAYKRFTDSQQSRFNNVFNVAGLGQTAATTMGSNLIGAAKYTGDTSINANQFAGTLNNNAADLTTGRTIQGENTAQDYLTQGANAQAAGKVSGSNALWSGINGGINNAAGIYLASQNPNVFGSSSRAPVQPASRWIPANGTNIFSPQQVAA